MNTTERPRVAAFDFDGTVSSRDNVLPFFHAVAGAGGLLRAAVLTSPKLIAAKLIDARRDDAKAAMVRRVFAGRPVAVVAAAADAFVDDVIANHLHPAVVARVEWHRARGDRVVLVSASLDSYLEGIGRRLHFDAALGTALEIGNGTYTGSIVGPNVRRAEKVVRLDTWMASTGISGAEVWAYGDSRGDDELLARADHAFKVKRGTLRREQPPS